MEQGGLVVLEVLTTLRLVPSRVLIVYHAGLALSLLAAPLNAPAVLPDITAVQDKVRVQNVRMARIQAN